MVKILGLPADDWILADSKGQWAGHPDDHCDSGEALPTKNQAMLTKTSWAARGKSLARMECDHQGRPALVKHDVDCNVDALIIVCIHC
jgi:hypothetical protein